MSPSTRWKPRGPAGEGSKTDDDGTLLIQDIEKISASAQWQLLRFMDRTMTARRRLLLMTATTAHLFNLVQTGQFRDDLFYRLNVIHVTIPPLLERTEDIPLMSAAPQSI